MEETALSSLVAANDGVHSSHLLLERLRVAPIQNVQTEAGRSVREEAKGSVASIEGASKWSLPCLATRVRVQ